MTTSPIQFGKNTATLCATPTPCDLKEFFRTLSIRGFGDFTNPSCLDEGEFANLHAIHSSPGSASGLR